MTTANNISPAKVCAQILVNADIGLLPGVPGQILPVTQIPGNVQTPVYTLKMPDAPDQVVCLYDTAGKYNGRLMRGQTTTHPGVSVIVRAPNGDGYKELCIPITDAFDNFFYSQVTVDEIPYGVHSVYRIGDIISLGEETGKRRQLWSINYRMCFIGF
jgi:hypothetical protein